MDLFCDDCLDLLPSLPAQSIDLVLVDPPHGRTQCSWDQVLPFVPLWEQYARLLKPAGAIAVIATEPFTSQLICSRLDWYQYSWVWEKSKASGWLNAKRRPMPAHEDIPIFSPTTARYYPQMRQGKPYDKGLAKAQSANDVYGRHGRAHVRSADGKRYPRSVLYFKTAESEGRTYHKSQKPVALLAYLIETYTRPGERVLDPCMGSGSTGAACLLTGREFVGIERDAATFQVAAGRLKEVEQQLSVT